MSNNERILIAPASKSEPSPRNWVTEATLFFALLSCWLCAHPYRGIIHDARLYAVQALSHLHPASFNKDLFLAYGSQDRFTLFSHIYAPLIRIWSPGTAAILLLAVAHLIWLWGAARLVFGLIKERKDAALALAAVLLLPSFYGGQNLLRYGEGFLTPRIFAEGAILHALAFALSGRFARAAILICFSALWHPLYAGGGLAIIWLILCFRDRRWILAGVAAGAAIAALVFAGAPLFQRLKEPYDAQWWDVVRTRNDLVVPSLWGGNDWSRVIFQCSLVVWSVVWSKGESRRLSVAVIAAGALSLALSLTGVVLFRNVLITQVQVWRNLWLLSLFANAAAGYIASVIWRTERNPIPLGGILIFLVFWRLFPWILLPLSLTAAGFLAWRHKHPSTEFPRRANALFWIAFWATIAIAVSTEITRVLAEVGEIDGPFRYPVTFFSTVGPLHAILLGSAAYAFGLVTRRKPAVLLILAAASCAAFLLAWDNRTPWQKWVEAGESAPSQIESALKQDAQVFWLDGITPTWLKLKRPSYFSLSQGGGVLFNRQTAVTYQARAEHVGRLEPRDNLRLSHTVPEALGYATPIITTETLAATCRSAKDLDAIISGRRVSGVPSIEWQAPVSRLLHRWADNHRYFEREQAFYLYRCADFR